jgi:hypothetical protein
MAAAKEQKPKRVIAASQRNAAAERGRVGMDGRTGRDRDAT